jgi:tetratricopeptide (TPR) repeat protein
VIVNNADPAKRTTTLLADRLLTNMQIANKTKQILLFIFLLCFAFNLNTSAQSSDTLKLVGQAQTEFDNGNYKKAIEIAEIGIEKARNRKANLLISKGLGVVAGSQISLRKYELAETSLNEAIQILSEVKEDVAQKAEIYSHLAWLRRTQRKYAEALEYSRKALALAPTSRQAQGEHYLNLGKIMFSLGYDVTAIIWLEKAEQFFEKERTSSSKLDIYRILSLAWASKLNYQKALNYGEKLVALSENTQFKYKYRQALFELATNLSAAGQNRKAIKVLEKGLKASIEQNHIYQRSLFLSFLLLNSLDNNDVSQARVFLEQLEAVDAGNEFAFERTLGKAVISAFTKQFEISENLFTELDNMKKHSEFILPRWKIKIAERNGNWEEVILLNQKVLDLTLEDNFRDDLPAVYLDFAKAYYNLDQYEKSLEYLEKSLAIIEEIRSSENSQLTLAVLETYHHAYRLLTQIKIRKPQEALESADFLKARFLN